MKKLLLSVLFILPLISFAEVQEIEVNEPVGSKEIKSLVSKSTIELLHEYAEMGRVREEQFKKAEYTLLKKWITDFSGEADFTTLLLVETKVAHLIVKTRLKRILPGETVDDDGNINYTKGGWAVIGEPEGKNTTSEILQVSFIGDPNVKEISQKQYKSLSKRVKKILNSYDWEEDLHPAASELIETTYYKVHNKKGELAGYITRHLTVDEEQEQTAMEATFDLKGSLVAGPYENEIERSDEW